MWQKDLKGISKKINLVGVLTVGKPEGWHGANINRMGEKL